MAVSSTTGGLRTGVCLSTDRPQNPYNGQVIYETDTNRTLVWDNSAWVVVADPALVSFSGTGATVTADAMTVAGENVTPYTGRRNLIYNGAMNVAQRGTSVAGITSTGYFTADRWNTLVGNLGTWTQSIENDAPTGSGFRKSLKMLCTTADASPDAGDWCNVQQIFEGQDCQHIKKGTPNAEQLTLSFWVKSNVTGTYIACVLDNNNLRICSASYTVSASSTWEKKTITFPADTAGVLNDDNGVSFRVQWLLAVGSDWTSGTLNTTWASTVTANRGVGQTNLAAATNNYWQITGVQLEVGDKATPFENRSYGEELALCQRYYEKSYDVATAPGTATGSGFILAMPGGAQASSSGIHDAYVSFSTTKRANPTVSIYDPAGNINKCRRTVVGVANYDNQSVIDVNAYTNGVYFRSSSGSAATHTVSCHFTASAEL